MTTFSPENEKQIAPSITSISSLDVVDSTIGQSIDNSTTLKNTITPELTDKTLPKELELPSRAIETYEGHAFQSSGGNKWSTYHVKSYDNLTNIFHKLGFQKSLKTLEQDKDILKELSQIKTGSIVRATSANGKQLSELVFTLDKENSYQITLNKSGEYKGAWKKGLFEVRQARASFTIRNGLFFDGRKAGIADTIIKQIVKVFDWDIDFSHDVRVDDKVTAVFEEIYHAGYKVGNQNLLATEFTNKGHVLRAIQYTYQNGKKGYFTPAGQEMKKAFIRTPIAHARVSSHFNPGRFHPVLHKFRAHKGTDFAGRRGTKIMATGNGVIKSLGRKGGYGRTIIIQHKDGYTTLYAHMSRYKKGLKIGEKVYQGDTIGYVGSSGLATGPHLHYEFRKKGKAMDSMSASLPHSMSLSSNELQDFRNKAINLVLQLNVLHRFVKAKIDISSNIGG
ncbi:MAG: M23 family metallopeptidase [Cocleimonas sp.]